MHSSRMRTGRSYTICRSLLPGGWGGGGGGVCAWLGGGGVSGPGGGVCLFWGGGVPGPGDGVSGLGGWWCAWSGGGGGVPGLGGVWSRGGGVSGPGRGVCAWLGGVLPQCLVGYHTPPVNRMTDRCKNITLATTLLRPVKIFVITVKGSNLPHSHLLSERPGCYHRANKTHVETGSLN